ncbi:MAG: adenine deaminase [Bacteroidales bacterium]
MEMQGYTVRGNIVDVVNKEIFPGEVKVQDGKIQSIIRKEVDENQYILPGLVDAHIHVESSMLCPSEFGRIASVHGTVATVSDPHEIANVMGMDGIRFMIDNAKLSPVKIYFGAPPCVPATSFESSGATLGPKEMEELLSQDEIKYMGEMMNFPGVIHKDPEIMEKIRIAQKYQKPIDGHAPGLKGKDAETYVKAGISTDHECFTMEEALEKIKYGMKIQIREGSAARNFDALSDLLKDNVNQVLFCSDDKHPHELVDGHINLLVKKSIELGYNPIDVIRAASYNAIKHYQLNVGLLQENDSADFIIVDNLNDFNILNTYVDGNQIAHKGKCLIKSQNISPVNRFFAKPISAEILKIKAEKGKLKSIDIIEGELVTKTFYSTPNIKDNNVVSDIENDVLKMVVLSRYREQKPAIGFIHNMGFKRGAIASTVAHDSHNIIAVGCSDEEIAKAINLVIEHKGGIALVNEEKENIFPLPVAGLMTFEDAWKSGKKYEEMEKAAIQLGSNLKAPYMTLSFMALLVIPELKLSDQGLFDGNQFCFTSLFEKE